MTVEELIAELELFPRNARIELETKWGTTWPTQVNWDRMIGPDGKPETRCTISDYPDSLERQRRLQSQSDVQQTNPTNDPQN